MFREQGMSAINNGKGRNPAPSRNTPGSARMPVAANPRAGLNRDFNLNESPAEKHARLYPVQQPNNTPGPNYRPTLGFLKQTDPKKLPPTERGGNRTNLKNVVKARESKARAAIKVHSATKLLKNPKVHSSEKRLYGLEYLTGKKTRPNVPNGLRGTTIAPKNAYKAVVMRGLLNIPDRVAFNVGATPVPYAVPAASVSVASTAGTMNDVAEISLEATNEVLNNGGVSNDATKPKANWPVLVMAGLLVFLVLKGRA